MLSTGTNKARSNFLSLPLNLVVWTRWILFHHLKILWSPLFVFSLTSELKLITHKLIFWLFEEFKEHVSSYSAFPRIPFSTILKMPSHFPRPTLDKPSRVPQWTLEEHFYLGITIFYDSKKINNYSKKGGGPHNLVIKINRKKRGFKIATNISRMDYQGFFFDPG